ncbi:hypothetical protein JOD43_000182 [Pullulanibacillus pueri]|uniref:Uncharacterized protein n=1 Tax=Pullulanibacillus pueri TaxID=1437324 RepID=A0A8J2ZSN6_9BACL|nr:hypothetical protein [Pullulanibacillus pueri]MBM7680023.1 hypothetical protein [Pullulanibacillus pueri]GGH73984.1 hypothetical protein GCM10007096_01770 [Pullulanibacillus pueri]
MNFAPMVVNLLGFKINVMERTATLSFGPIQQMDINNSTKRNQGFGEENGDLTSVNIPIGSVMDQDLADANFQKWSIT